LNAHLREKSVTTEVKKATLFQVKIGHVPTELETGGEVMVFFRARRITSVDVVRR